MIGFLPKTLEVSGKEYPIRTDFRTVLVIFQALNDPELEETEKAIVILQSLYEEIPPDLQEALDKAAWFMDGGQTHKGNEKPVMDWEQDEQMIFSAVNKVAGYETRTIEYLHWWSFLGLFNEIGEGLFSTVVNIRKKRNTGKKLDKTEQEFYKRNREIVNLKKRLSKEEQQALDEVNKLLGR